MNKYLIFTILNLIWLTSFSQQTFSLEDLVKLALEKNYQIQIVNNQKQITQNQNTIGNAGMLPSVNLVGSSSWDMLNSELKFFSGEIRSGQNAKSNQINAMAELNWTVFDGFAMFANKDKLELMHQISMADHRYYILQTIYDISELYYLLIKEINLLENFKENLKVSEFRYELEKEKVKLGMSTALNYHQAAIDYQTDSISILRMELIINNLQLQISSQIQAESTTNLAPNQITIPLNGIPILDSLIKISLRYNANLDKSKIQEILAETEKKIAQSILYPQISMYGNYSLNRSKSEIGFMESSQNFGPSFGVSIRYNLYNGGKSKTQIENIELDRKNTELEFKETERQTITEIKRLHQNYLSLINQLQKMKEIEQRINSSLSISQQQLKMGSISEFEFRQIQLNSINQKNQIIEIQYQLKLIELNLARLSGVL